MCMFTFSEFVEHYLIVGLEKNLQNCQNIDVVRLIWQHASHLKGKDKQESSSPVIVAREQFSTLISKESVTPLF